MKKPIFIAEIKTVSPFGFKSPYDKDLLEYLAIGCGDYVSSHTDPRWGGSMNNLALLKQKLKNQGRKQKLVAKGIHQHDGFIKAALDYGADYVVVVGRIPAKKYLSKCWLEPLTEHQYPEMKKAKPNAIILNSRNLMGGKDREWTVKVKPKGIKLIQASNIKTVGEIQPWADGYIVGANLPQFTVNQTLDLLLAKRA